MKLSKILFFAVVFFLVFIVAGCNTEKETKSVYDALPVSTEINNCDTVNGVLYGQHIVIGEISQDNLPEVSGLASSSIEGLLWMINDSDNKPYLYLVDFAGRVKGAIELPEEQKDWEDLALSHYNDTTKIYIGDIGNNKRKRSKLELIEIDEKKCLDLIMATSDAQVILIPAESYTKIEIEMPEEVFDCESLFCDPLNNILYLVSKREENNIVFQLVQKESGHYRAEPIMKIPYFFITAADISADGKQIIMKSYHNIYLWNRSISETVKSTLLNKPTCINYVPEAQGESICFINDNYDFITTSELRNEMKTANIRLYNRRSNGK